MSKFKQGQRVKVKESVSPNGQYGEFAGMSGVITEVGNQWNNSINGIKMDNGKYIRYVGWSVLELDLNTLTTIEKLEKQKAKITEQLEEVNSKIAYVKETKSEKFDETEFKVYQTLKAFDNKEMTDIEKAQLISKLIKETK